jgi:hypothetical protein
MKTYREVEVRGQLHAPAALAPGKDLPVPMGLGAGSAPVSLDAVEKRK